MVISVSHTKLSESVVEFCLSSSLFYPGLSEEHHHLCPLDTIVQKGAAKKHRGLFGSANTKTKNRTCY